MLVLPLQPPFLPALLPTKAVVMHQEVAHSCQAGARPCGTLMLPIPATSPCNIPDLAARDIAKCMSDCWAYAQVQGKPTELPVQSCQGCCCLVLSVQNPCSHRPASQGESCAFLPGLHLLELSRTMRWQSPYLHRPTVHCLPLPCRPVHSPTSTGGVRT